MESSINEDETQVLTQNQDENQENTMDDKSAVALSIIRDRLQQGMTRIEQIFRNTYEKIEFYHVENLRDDLEKVYIILF